MTPSSDLPLFHLITVSVDRLHRTFWKFSGTYIRCHSLCLQLSAVKFRSHVSDPTLKYDVAYISAVSWTSGWLVWWRYSNSLFIYSLVQDAYSRWTNRVKIVSMEQLQRHLTYQSIIVIDQVIGCGHQFNVITITSGWQFWLLPKHLMTSYHFTLNTCFMTS